MKKLLFIIIMLHSLQGFSQQIDVSFGKTTKSEKQLCFGVNYKPPIKPLGWYFNFYGMNTYQSYDDGVDYSDICDKTSITTDTEGNNNFGMNLGLLYNLFNKNEKYKKIFYIMSGIGYCCIQEISTTHYYYQWLQFPDLNEGRTVTFLSKYQFSPTIELLGNINIPLHKSPITFGIESGINSSMGFVFMGYIGFNLANFHKNKSI